MSTTPRNPRPRSGPGRRKPRSRPGPRSVSHRRQEEDPSQPAFAGRTRGGVTRRAVAFAVVAVLLLLSYGTSLRTWIKTEQENAENVTSMQQSQARIDELNAELARWDDPDYERAQVRERLGWVMPGETGYRVIGPHGEPVGEHLQKPAWDPNSPPPRKWWERMWGSVEAADQPAPVPGQPVATASPKPPITDGTRTATPTPTPLRSPSARPGARRTPAAASTRTQTPTTVPAPGRTSTPTRTPR